jgi:hypothetical protein
MINAYTPTHGRPVWMDTVDGNEAGVLFGLKEFSVFR